MKNLKIFYMLLFAALPSYSNAQKESSIESYSPNDNMLQNQTIAAYPTTKSKNKKKYVPMEEPYDSSDGFFKGRIIYSTEEDDACQIDSGLSFEAMASCHQDTIDRLNSEIEQKINSSKLGKYNLTWFKNERKKIEQYCKSETKRYIKANKGNIAADLEVFELQSNRSCIKDSLYQLLKKLK